MEAIKELSLKTLKKRVSRLETEIEQNAPTILIKQELNLIREALEVLEDLYNKK